VPRGRLAPAGLAGALVALVLLTTAPPSAALTGPGTPGSGRPSSPLDSASVSALEQRLTAARARLHQLQVEAAQAVEAYDAAAARLRLAQTADGAAAALVARAAADAATARAELGRWAAAAYRAGGPMADWSAVVSAEGPAQLVRRAAAVRFVGQARAGALARAVAAAAVADQARLSAEQALVTVTSDALVTAQARAGVLDRVDAQQGEVNALEQEQQQLLDLLALQRHTTTEEEVARLVAAEAERSGAAANWSLTGTLLRPDQTQPPGTEEGAARSVAFALAQVGKPYLWAAAGPDAFDCSGLTMRSWEHGGVTLPHYSAGQAQLVLPVPLNQMRPGDLVFFAADLRDVTTVYHVALYVGGGQMVEAPRPGAAVRVASVWQTGLFGAGRP